MTLPRILFVDDDADLLETMADLWSCDYEVKTALRGDAALAILDSFSPDVVVSDMRMPGMDGATLLAIIRARAPHVARVLLTGHADLEAAVRAVNEGGVLRYLTKPCPPEVMADALVEALEHRKLRDELDRRVLQTESLTKQLAHAERLATLGTMSAALGHEMRNALAVMQCAVEEIARDADESRVPDPEVTSLLVSSQRRLVAQSHAALSLARRANDKPHEVHVADVIRELVESVQRSGLLKRMKLVLDLASDVTVLVDPNELEQICLNLVKNAIDAMADRHGCIAVCLRRIGTRAYLEVADNAGGIAEEHLARIFEPYFTTKPVGVGTGLGLPVVRQLVEKIGGSIQIASERGHGTTVRIELPCARSENVRIARASRAIQPHEAS